MTEDDVRQLLRGLGEEAPPADSLVRVRQRVAERTATGRRRVLWGPVLAAAVAALCLLVVVLSRPSPHPRPRMPAPPPVVAVVKPPAPVKPAPAAPPRVARKPRKRDGLVIRMETNDPDVVILLIADDSE